MSNNKNETLEIRKTIRLTGDLKDLAEDLADLFEGNVSLGIRNLMRKYARLYISELLEKRRLEEQNMLGLIP